MTRSVKLSLATVFLFGITAAPTVAKPLEMGAHSAECKEIITRLVEVTNATFDHYSPSGNNVFLKSPDMVLSCTSHRLTGISLTWDASGFPPNTWFRLVASAGKAVTGLDVNKLESASHLCHRAALKDTSELAEL